MRHNAIFFLILITGIILTGCKEDVLPKPKAMLRLEYQQGSTQSFMTDNYKFHVNQLAEIEEKEDASLTVHYPGMKGSVFMTYKEIDNNLESLLTDAQKLAYEHVVKADDIVEQQFVNEEEGVFGMYYEVRGNAASQAQFYVTDSTDHFLTGSLYFYAKPNYDSIYPAAVYIQRDMRQIMETLKWR